ncbi:hypothetical protein NUU61_004127 [Penicillium alfredii]|uniref:Aminoglycoside phosphotransferase domain-containing protein n=1 Tax=Penicillium alfredii TaxID=1506179 RepID=A0A9W9FKM2_9EURO|nr:uncharacterized protein NUU61_004127 [Penicillium alfredii]KAJ5101905.1 hypothetical protein NUU61_004127 [Penicillium alfredii]
MLGKGIPCTVELSREGLSAMMGNQNCRVGITFTSSPPQEIHDCILRSEAATMVYLQQHNSIPTPKIDWACESDPGNPLGVDYILMEKLDGNPLDWQAATLHLKEKVMQQLVAIFLECPLGSFAFALSRGHKL